MESQKRLSTRAACLSRFHSAYGFTRPDAFSFCHVRACDKKKSAARSEYICHICILVTRACSAAFSQPPHLRGVRVCVWLWKDPGQVKNRSQRWWGRFCVLVFAPVASLLINCGPMTRRREGGRVAAPARLTSSECLRHLAPKNLILSRKPWWWYALFSLAIHHNEAAHFWSDPDDARCNTWCHPGTVPFPFWNLPLRSAANCSGTILINANDVQKVFNQ